MNRTNIIGARCLQHFQRQMIKLWTIKRCIDKGGELVQTNISGNPPCGAVSAENWKIKENVSGYPGIHLGMYSFSVRSLHACIQLNWLWTVLRFCLSRKENSTPAYPFRAKLYPFNSLIAPCVRISVGPWGHSLYQIKSSGQTTTRLESPMGNFTFTKSTNFL